MAHPLRLSHGKEAAGMEKYAVVVYVLAAFGFLVLLVAAITIGLEELGARIRRFRLTWRDFKNDVAGPLSEDTLSSGSQGRRDHSDVARL